MASRRRTAAIVLVLCSAAMGAGFLAFVQPGSSISKWMIKLPRTRDSLLLGRWEGQSRFLDDKPRRTVTVLRADGKGWTSVDGKYRGSFDWGTEGAVIYTRRMAVDAWSGIRRPYVLGPGGIVQFRDVKMFDCFTETMKRVSDRELIDPKVGDSVDSVFASFGPADSNDETWSDGQWTFEYRWPKWTVTAVAQKVVRVDRH